MHKTTKPKFVQFISTRSEQGDGYLMFTSCFKIAASFTWCRTKLFFSIPACLSTLNVQLRSAVKKNDPKDSEELDMMHPKNFTHLT